MAAEEREKVYCRWKLEVRCGRERKWSRMEERGVSHRSCIVNEKFFTNQILFHRRPGGKASLMERWMDGKMRWKETVQFDAGSQWFECNYTFKRKTLESGDFLTIAEEMEVRRCLNTDAVWRISFQNARYPFLQHRIIGCRLFHVSHVAHVSDLIAKYSRESNNFSFDNDIRALFWCHQSICRRRDS